MPVTLRANRLNSASRISVWAGVNSGSRAMARRRSGDGGGTSLLRVLLVLLVGMVDVSKLDGAGASKPIAPEGGLEPTAKPDGSRRARPLGCQLQSEHGRPPTGHGPGPPGRPSAASGLAGWPLGRLGELDLAGGPLCMPAGLAVEAGESHVAVGMVLSHVW